MTDEEIKQEAEKALDERMGTVGYIKRDNVQKPFIDGYIQGYKEVTKWHDLRKNPDDLPELLPPELGYNKLVLCFEWRSDSRGKKAKFYSLDRWNPEPYNEWDEKRHGQYDAWCELPEPPEE